MADSTGSFPTDEDTFADDPRIFFDRETSSFHLEDENGNEWEFISRAQQWVKSVRVARHTGTLTDVIVTLQVEDGQREAFDAQYKVDGVKDEVEQATTAAKRKAADDARV